MTETSAEYTYDMKKKSSTPRVAALRERRRAQGILKLEVYANTLDHPEIKLFVAKINKRRIKIENS